MVPGDPSGWHILSAVLLFLRRAYLFKLNQPKTTRDDLWSGSHTHTPTHTHTHTSQSDFLARCRERGHSRGTIRYVFLQKDSDWAVGKQSSALDWLLSDSGPGEMEG